MTVNTFDPLAYARKLEEHGFTREQAEIQADALREIADNRAINKEYLDARLLETEARIRETEARLQKEMRDSEIRLLKWQLGIALALAAIMARGFGWLGF